MLKKLGTITAALALAFIVSSFAAGEAEAASVTCDGGIDWIDFRQMSSSNSELLFGCRSSTGTTTNFYAYTGAGTCSQYNQNPDTLKFWFAMVQGWALSSKRVQIYYETCAGASQPNRITAISLRRQ